MELDTYLGESGVPTKKFSPFKAYPGYGYGFQVCGCCGARQAYTMEEFNNPAVYNKYADDPWTPVWNRGFLLYLNPEHPEQIEEIPTSIVEKIQLGEDVLYVRMKVSCD